MPRISYKSHKFSGEPRQKEVELRNFPTSGSIGSGKIWVVSKNVFSIQSISPLSAFIGFCIA